jgi:hypothetical protein
VHKLLTWVLSGLGAVGARVPNPSNNQTNVAVWQCGWAGGLEAWSSVRTFNFVRSISSVNTSYLIRVILVTTGRGALSFCLPELQLVAGR